MVIYQTTNLINGKKYIGKDTKNSKTYLGSGTFLKKAIKKYGRENFKKEILEYCLNEDELKQKEEYWLLFYDAANNSEYYNCINISHGCPKGLHKGRKNTWSKGIKGHIGPVWDKEQKEIHSLKLKGREIKWGDKISQSKKGKSISKEHKDKISQKLKNRKRPFNAGKDLIPILQYDLQGNFIREWKSISEAQNNIIRGDIRACLNNKTKKAGGFFWKLKQQTEE